MSRLKYYVLLSRPRFWLYTLGPCMIGIAAASSGPKVGVYQLLSPFALVSYIFFGLIINLLVYGINDFFDADVDVYSSKKTDKEIVGQPVNIRTITIIPLLISIMYLIFVPNQAAQITLIFMLFLGISYSLPPLRFKTKLFLDSFSNGFYILPGVVAYTSLQSSLPNLIVVTASWIWAMGMHLFSAIPDIQPDRKAGITTTATFFDRQKSLILTSVYWAISTILAAYIYPPLILIGSIYIIMPLLVYSHKLDDHRAYWLFPYINGFLGFAIFFIAFMS